MRRFGLFLLAILFCFSAAAQAPKKIAIRAGKLIDGKSDQPISNALILIEDKKIVSVTPGGSAPAGVEVIDLSHATVLPGFILIASVITNCAACATIRLSTGTPSRWARCAADCGTA